MMYSILLSGLFAVELTTAPPLGLVGRAGEGL